MGRESVERARPTDGKTRTSVMGVRVCERLRARGAARLSLLAALLLTLGSAFLFAGSSFAAGSGAPVSQSTPAVAGTPRDGLRLKAVKGSWSGQTPILYSYRWQRCESSGEPCKGISGATKAAYKAGHEDVGHTLRVVVTGTNELGTASATSTASTAVAPAAPARKSAPKLSGPAQDGQLISAGSGVWKGTPPFSYSYRWEACDALGEACTTIPGASEVTYRVASSQIGGRLRAIVTAGNAAGIASATSSASKRIVPGPPISTSPPAITGSLQEGQTLTATTGNWAGTGPFSYTYQWRRCVLGGGACEDIAGASAPTYTLGLTDLASRLIVFITATGSLGSATASSAETSPVEAILPMLGVAPAISGLLQDGQLLSVDPGSWSGSAPIGFSYQWQQCNAAGEACSNIAGATGSTLSLATSLIGSTLDVVVTATNAAGSSSAATPVTSVVAGLLPSNTGQPSISGLLQDGQLLSVATDGWSGSAPISYAYQWQQCNAAGKACVNIPGATGSTLSLLPGLIGSTLDVVVTATNAAGSSSAATPVTSVVAGLLPSNTGLPSISGLLQDGQLLSVATGGWSGSAPISYSYQWQKCDSSGHACADIAGANGSTLSLVTGLIGSTLDVVVTATNVAGSASVTTPVSGLVAGLLPSNTGSPSITGLLQDGQLVSASPGVWTGSAPISYGYQWQQCNAAGKACVNIPGATGSTLSLLPGLIGSTLDVVVTATNVAGSTSVTTSVSGLVKGLLPSNTALPSISGSLKVGQLLSAAMGSWSGTAPIAYAYQWQLCNVLASACTNIAGATSSTFLLGALDLGLPLRVVVTASNVAGSTPATSAPTGLIAGLGL